MTTEYKEMLQWGDTAAALAAANPTPLARQIVLETDTRRWKVGDGSTAWNSLIYWNGTSEDVTALTVGGLAWYEIGADSPDSYQALGRDLEDVGALTGNTGYTRQTTGRAVAPHVQARMRRCVLKDDGSAVAYYLDCDDSTKKAGSWLRIHEGFTDPVKPIPGQATTGCAALRRGVEAWSATKTYSRGDWVLSGGYLWESLADANLNAEPAAGTVAADLTGTDGQVMVEIPRFYVAYRYDPSARRHAWDAAIVPSEVKPFPTLTSDLDSTLATSRTVNGVTYVVHPAFTKASKQRSHRYWSAFSTTATNTDNNTIGVLRSIGDGSTVQSTTISLINFRAKSRNRNTGLADPSGVANNVWALVDYYLAHAVQLLYLLEFRTLYAQNVLGGGNQSGSDYQKIAGRSAPCGNATGVFDASGVLQTPVAGTDFDGMVYRGIEDWYGSSWTAIDGWNVSYQADGTQRHYVCNTPASFLHHTTTGHDLLSAISPAANGNPGALNPDTFIPARHGGNSSTYTTDYFYRASITTGWRIVYLGGAAGDGSYAGPFGVNVNNSASSASANIGAALSR